MRFTHPVGLFLLLLLPLAAALGWPRRGYGRGREILSLVIRLLILLALVLSLAGFETGSASDRLAVVYLIDISDSMPPQAVDAAAGYIRQSILHMGPDDQAAVVAFGEEPLVERPMSPSRQLGPITSIPNAGQTDLSAAIRLGLALYPPAAARRMVILSDGSITRGNTVEAARLAAALGVQIQVVPFSIDHPSEALVSSVEAPDRLNERERFELRVTTQAAQDTPADIRVLANGKVLYAGKQTLPRGEHSFSLPVTAGAPGFYRYQVQIDPVEDGYYQNNELSAFSLVEGPPRVLVVASSALDGGSSTPLPGESLSEGVQLAGALQSTGLQVETLRPAELPSELGELNSYSAVVLVDIPARDLSLRQMAAIQSYVREAGGGLVAVGGPNSFGVGGYYHTPLEETLPVEMQIKDEQRRPSLTMVFVIDHSGSMSDTSGGATKLELAKEAAIRSVDLMFPDDRIGVIAFDEQASWVVPVTDLSDPDAVKNAIGSIRSGGGTDILAGLQAMASVLPSDPGKIKHVILLTDGGADPNGIPELVARLHNQNDITLTTVGVGQDAAPYLASLAELGGGRYHFAADPGSIPSIFTEETSLATRAYLVEHPFAPRQAGPSPILSGIEAVPELLGYVATTAKASAQTILVTDLSDPLLATWQYGLGRAAAFTSDATARWARSWLGWEGFPNFWSQVVNDVIQNKLQRNPLGIRVEQSADGSRASVIADAVTENGEYLNDYALTAQIRFPDGRSESFQLEQVAPGRYEASFEPGSSGAYWISVSGEVRDRAEPVSSNPDEVAGTTGWVLSYSQEYRIEPSDPQLLSQLAGLTGGSIASADPGAVYRHDLPAPSAVRPAWPWLLGLAVLLLPVDIGVRRLVIDRADIRRAVSRLDSLAVRRSRAEGAVTIRTRRMDALLRAKQRANLESQAALDGAQGRLPIREPVKSDEGIMETSDSDPNPSSVTSGDDIELNTANPAAGLSGSESLRTTERLLASKRDRRKKQS